MRLRIAVLLLLCAASLSAAGRRRAVRHPSPPEGPCAVRGLANLHYSTDGGVTWSRNADEPTKTGMWDLVSLGGDPEALLAVTSRDVYESTDAGCTWTLEHTITQDIHHTLHLAPAGGKRAFIWTEDWALRYDDGVVITLPLPETIGGLGVNPGNREHVRVLDLDDGRVRESFDGGMTWRDGGGLANGRINAAAFDPSDFQHIIAGVQTRGIVITRDGGRTWTNGAQTGTVCRVEFVASSPNVVWVTTPTRPGGAAFVHRSTNGGASLEAIGGFTGLESNVCMPVLPNPHDANTAVIPFREIHQFDATRKSVTSWTCCGGRMDRIAWSSADPARVYVYSPPR
jgi:BNR/Asp-box repeat